MKPEVFHPAQIEVQTRAGVKELAARVGRGLRRELPDIARRFVAEQRMLFVGSRDRQGRVWASVMFGDPGFLQAINEYTIRVDGKLPADDPLIDIIADDAELSFLILDPESRRRMVMSGKSSTNSDGTFSLTGQRIFSLCPQYIQKRRIDGSIADRSLNRQAYVSGELSATQRDLIEAADTFFVATFNNETGAYISHRGGQPGFAITRESGQVLFPNYKGNMILQSLGNLAANPHVGLLWFDFEFGHILQLSGEAEIVWDDRDLQKFPGAQQVVVVDVRDVIDHGEVSPLRWAFEEYSSSNPRIK